VVLALGGASWPATGSDGDWVGILQSLGIAVSRLQSANCGWEVAWTPETRGRVEGQPLHNLCVRAGETSVIGELMPVAYGIEGTLIYHLGRTLRAMASPEIRIDFKPAFTAEQLVRKMESVRRNFIAEALIRWKLPDAACAILEQFHGPFDCAEKLALAAKDCRIPLLAPRPIAEAISTAGGVCWSELDENLMLKKLPGVFCAGEMIDWEAPTGGFLLQGCFATGTRAGRAAAEL
jgi:predicted flavoprotein YhiN